MTKTPAALVLPLNSPRDTVEALPHLLGFVPESSLVLIGLATDPASGRQRSGPVLRIDLGAQHPDPADVLSEVVPTLPAEYRTCVLVAIAPPSPEGGSASDERWAAERVRTGALLMACVDVVRGAAWTVIDALLVVDDRFVSMLCVDPGCCSPSGAPWSPPDSSAASARVVAAGLRMPLSTRASLVDRLAVDEAAVAACDEHPTQPVTPPLLVMSLDAVTTAIESGESSPAPADLRVVHDALVIGLLRDECVRWTLGMAHTGTGRRDAAREAWRVVARSSPPSSRSAACAMVAMAALLTGDGAEANVAIDLGRCGLDDPGAALLSNMERVAAMPVPPSHLHALLSEIYATAESRDGTAA